MAHILLLEVPGGNDFMILEKAVFSGHEVTFFTADLKIYEPYFQKLQLAQQIVLIEPFRYTAFEQKALEIHSQKPFDAILCLIDIRMIEASQLAEKLKLKFLNSKTATLIRDKFNVRTHLSLSAITQPAYALAATNEEIKLAIDSIGLPVIVKPCDGYGSQNIVTFLSEDDFHPLIDPLADYLPSNTKYGFGVCANDRLIVEKKLNGQVIGCDTFTQNGQHILLGINEKLFFDAPYFGIKGGCFPSEKFNTVDIENYVFSILSALNFDFGAAHTEIMVTEKELYLIEVNPRLVGAHIPRLLSYALERSIYDDLIALHLDQPLDELHDLKPKLKAVSRWITATQEGVIQSIQLPEMYGHHIKEITFFKKEGDYVRPPFNNGDRIGYVMVTGHNQYEAEQLADAFIRNTRIIFQPLNA